MNNKFDKTNCPLELEEAYDNLVDAINDYAYIKVGESPDPLEIAYRITSKLPDGINKTDFLKKMLVEYMSDQSLKVIDV